MARSAMEKPCGPGICESICRLFDFRFNNDDFSVPDIFHVLSHFPLLVYTFVTHLILKGAWKRVNRKPMWRT